MNWQTIALILYGIVLVLVMLRILYETLSPTKTMAYLLLVFFVPVAGILFYLAFGVNYWKKKLYNKKMTEDELLLAKVTDGIQQYNDSMLKKIDVEQGDMGELATMLIKDLQTPLTKHNEVKLLVNGEEKFPELLKDLESAKDHIHIEYYIFEQDDIGFACQRFLHFLQGLSFHLDAHQMGCRGSSPTAGRRYIYTSRSQNGKMVVLDEYPVA